MPFNEESQLTAQTPGPIHNGITLSPTFRRDPPIEEQQLTFTAKKVDSHPHDSSLIDQAGPTYEQPSSNHSSHHSPGYHHAPTSQTSSYVPPQPHPSHRPTSPVDPPLASNGSTRTTTAVLAIRHVMRTQEQVHVMRQGSRFIVNVSLALLIAAYFLLGMEGGVDAVILFTLSLLPVFFILGTLRFFSSCKLSIALMVEMFWSGALLSILVASILELVSEYQTHLIWECQSKKPSVLCDLRFVIVVIVGVGFVEEFSKFLPLSRIKTDEADVPSHHIWWFRLVESPQSLALAGLCSAAGFAGIENIKYVFTSGTDAGVGTSLWRAVLAIPFHLACTTYASCQLAKLMFSPVEEPQGARTNQGQSTEPPELVSLSRVIPADTTPLRDEESQHRHDVISPSRTTNQLYSHHHHHIHFKHVSFLEYLKCLLIPSILHGFYDVGLFLAVQLMGLAGESSGPSVSTFLSWIRTVGTVPISAVDLSSNDYSVISDGPNTTPSPSSQGSDLYETLAVCCLGLSLGSYILILVLSVWAWKDLKKLPTSDSSSSTAVPTPYTVHYADQYEHVQITQTVHPPNHYDTLAASNSQQQSLTQEFSRQPVHSSELPQWRNPTETNNVGIESHRGRPQEQHVRSSISSDGFHNRIRPMNVEDDRREYFEH